MLVASPSVMSVEAEVLTNIRSQGIGGHTVADLRLPEAFLRRIADRIIRSTFEERHRQVIAEEGFAAQPPPIRSTADEEILNATIIRHKASPDVWKLWHAMPECRPENRGFRAPVLGRCVPGPGLALANSDAEHSRTANRVARRLAVDGLLATVAGIVRELGPSRPGEDALELLAGLGIPVDLLACFAAENESGTDVVRRIQDIVAGAATASQVERALAAVPFRFRPTEAGFVLHSDSGDRPTRGFRLQLTRGDSWGGPGDGGSVDVFRQLLAIAPGARYVVSIESRHLSALAATMKDWPALRSGTVTIIAEDLPVAQWAQDSGKAGLAGTRGVTLVPRYASRGEDGPTFIPGESRLAEGLAAAGLRIVHSPLLFQGGNLIMAGDAGSGRTLLIGEAEIWRNVALGLSEAQVIEAFRVEMGADRCIVLPAVSFHIDSEVTVRVCDGRLTAFVIDEIAGAKLIVEAALDALAASGAVPAEAGAQVAEHFRGGRVPQALSIAGPGLAAIAIGPGLFPQRIAELLSTGPGDSGIGNLQCLMLAMDLLTATTIAPPALPADRHGRAYLLSFQRRAADRRVMHRRLADAGFRVIPVPSVSEPERGVNALNGLHDSRCYLMPGYGGLYSRLDDAAAGVFRQHMGPGIEIIRVLCAETQRRSGGLRCAVSALAAEFFGEIAPVTR